MRKSRSRKLTRIIAGAALAIAAFTAGHSFVHIDWLPSLRTYGVSVGTDTRYCSGDFVRGHLKLSCEHAS